MSTISTEAFPLETEQLTPDSFQANLDLPVLNETGLTDTLDCHTHSLTLDRQFPQVRSCFVSAMIAFGTVIPGEYSQPINPDIPAVWEMMATYCSEEDQAEVADFFEPVTFNWDQDVFEVREAIRRYSEQIHADY